MLTKRETLRAIREDMRHWQRVWEGREKGMEDLAGFPEIMDIWMFLALMYEAEASDA
ncbi:MAG: hypothetical protein FD189_1063 [Elusimicrobia bacterium]|nr:MAG: hypothetical protein FD189_1063 [Elusimicrobiota bacterium]